MPDPTDLNYLAGLKAAQILCAERSRRHSETALRRSAEPDKASSVSLAVEALACAIAIHQLVEGAESSPHRKALGAE